MELSINNDEPEKEYLLKEVKGITPTIEKKLNEIGINTIEVLSMSDVEIVSVLGHFSKDKAIEYVLAAQQFLREHKDYLKEFCDANEVEEDRKKVMKIKTGSNDLDNLLFGGIETKSMTEFYGAFGSGKSQICHTLCVRATLPKVHGGADGANSIYIDTEGTFRPERISEIARNMGLDPIEVKSKIKYCHILNSSHLELIIRDLHKAIEELHPKLIIVDSIISLHKAEYIGRGMLADRQQRLNPMIHHLLKLAGTYNLAVVITNQVIANPDSKWGAEPLIASGGNIMAHASTYRIFLKRFSQFRTARMIDSPYHPYSDTKFTVTERGIEDISQKVKENINNNSESEKEN